MRRVTLVGGPQDGRVMEINGGLAVETLTCSWFSMESDTYQVHRYECSDPWTARWVWSEERTYG